tara:strand:+ start:17608 stop:19488 length:1881 start_codon:yes stop_codon:yes gene_type:complete
MKLVPNKEVFSTISFGVIAIRQTSQGLRKAMGAKIRARKSQINTRNIDRQKLLDSQKKDEKERILEAKPLKTNSSASKALKKKKGGFFDNLLEVIGQLIIGFLLDKLPQIVKFIEDLIAKVNKVITYVNQLMQGITKIFKEIGDVIKAVWSNLKEFDFTDKSGKIRKEFGELSDELGNEKNAAVAAFENIKNMILNYGKEEGYKNPRLENANNAEDKAEALITPEGTNVFDGSTNTPNPNNDMDPKTVYRDPNYMALLDLVAKSLDFSYTSIGSENDPELTSKTLEEVSTMDAPDVGRYGMNPDMLQVYASQAIIPMTAKFTPKIQDSLATNFLINKGLSHESTEEDFATHLKMFLGTGANKITIPDSKINEAFTRFKQGVGNGQLQSNRAEKIMGRGGSSIGDSRVVGYVGSTGRSSGPHIHIQRHPARDWRRDHITANHEVMDHIFVRGRPLSSYEVTSPSQPDRGGRPHFGPDFASKDINNAPIQFSPEISYNENDLYQASSGGEGNNILFTFKGRQYTIFHLSKGPDPINKKSNITPNQVIEVPSDAGFTLETVEPPISSTIEESIPQPPPQKKYTVPMPIINNTTAAKTQTKKVSATSMVTTSSEGRNVIDIMRVLNNHFT